MENLVDIPQIDYSSIVQNKTFEVSLQLNTQFNSIRKYKISAVNLDAAMTEVKKELSFGSIGYTNEDGLGIIVPMYSIVSITVIEVNE